ncbi:hypothetical protein HMPREF0682_2754 [Propionibacterium acidifaciens F0233]|uniref:Uncharacterized protein n=1 Tax=Propionibacterium acidifaciens F0233 TaxID=553198 RepID=U2RX42_9ACTN|nr:hypothetical protein HMPREF0682_2754 [Propionibacterium acidifaciens F0233]
MQVSQLDDECYEEGSIACWRSKGGASRLWRCGNYVVKECCEVSQRLRVVDWKCVFGVSMSHSRWFSCRVRLFLTMMAGSHSVVFRIISTFM